MDIDRGLFVPGGSFELAGACYAVKNGRLSEGERKRCGEKILRLRKCLLETAFVSQDEFLSFWSECRGYVEEAFAWEGGTDFFKEYVRSTRNPLGVRMCLLNLYERLSRSMSGVSSSGEALLDEQMFLEVTKGYDDMKATDALIRRKIRAGVIWRLVDTIESRHPGLVVASLEGYIGSLSQH